MFFNLLNIMVGEPSQGNKCFMKISEHRYAPRILFFFHNMKQIYGSMQLKTQRPVSAPAT